MGIKLSISGIVRWTTDRMEKNGESGDGAVLEGAIDRNILTAGRPNACQTTLAALRMLLARNRVRIS